MTTTVIMARIVHSTYRRFLATIIPRTINPRAAGVYGFQSPAIKTIAIEFSASVCTRPLAEKILHATVVTEQLFIALNAWFSTTFRFAGFAIFFFKRSTFLR